MELKCNTCGAINTFLKKDSYVICEFCRNRNTIDDVEVDDEDIEPIKYRRSFIYENRIKHIEEGIKKITDISILYKNYEINELIDSLVIRHNPIEDLKGISIFKLALLNMSDNNLKIINELPQMYGNSITLNFKNNPNLLAITDECIEQINQLKNLRSFKIYLNNCTQFDFKNFSKIKYKEILELKNYTEGDYIYPSSFEIVLQENCPFPEYLKQIGFKQKGTSWVIEGVVNIKKKPKEPVGCGEIISYTILLCVLAFIIYIILILINVK